MCIYNKSVRLYKIFVFLISCKIVYSMFRYVIYLHILCGNNTGRKRHCYNNMHLIYHRSNLSYTCIQLLYCSFIYIDLNNTTYEYTYLYLCWLHLYIHRYGTPGCIYKIDLLCYFYYHISSCVPCLDMKCIYHFVIYLAQSNNIYPIIMNHTLILYYKHLCKNYDYINNHIKSVFLSIYVLSLKCIIIKTLCEINAKNREFALPG